jgi:TolB-like protein/Tfp pilus assembly protein PilF
MRLLRDGIDLSLRHQVVQLLCVLVEHAGIPVSYEYLGLRAWGQDYVDKGTVAVTIHEVRNSLGEYRHYVQTAKGMRGYRFDHPELQFKPQTQLSQERCSVVLTTFEDITTNRDKAYLATGITLELGTTISKIGNLRVIKATPQTVQFLPLGQAAEIKYLIEGFLAGAGERLKVHVQLLSLPDRAIVWSNTYPTSVAELQGLQSRIAAKIAEAIKVKISVEETNKMRDEMVDSETYKLYLRGLHHWNRPTEIDLLRAVEYFRQALSRNQTYAKASGAMAHAYALLSLGGYMRPDNAMPQAKSAALKCLELSPLSPEGLSGLAAVEAYYLWNWKGAEELLKRSISLNPNYETSHHLYAMGCLIPQARFDEALREIRTALELSPLSPFIASCVGIVHFYARSYEQSIDQLDRALELQPHYHLAHWHRGWALAELGRFHEAISAITTAVEMSKESPQVIAALGQVYAAAGQTQASRRILRQLKQIAAERFVSPYDLALIHISLGENVKAFTLLKKAVDQRVTTLARLRVHPFFDRFRSDPKFVSLLRTINLSPDPPLEIGKESK